MPYFLGVDAGTTSMKAALFDLAGHMLAVAREEYVLTTPAPAVVECDPETYWRACVSVISQVIHTSGVAVDEVVTLAVSSQGETFIAVDAHGRPLRPAIVWLDNRAVEEAAELRTRFGDKLLFSVSGQPEVVPTWPACKLLWIKRHEPEVWSGAARFLMLEDYLLHRLTGEFVTEASLQSSSLLLDISSRRWWMPVFDYLGFAPARLGRLTEPGEEVGRISQTASAATGLSTRTLALAGAIDQVMGALGAGNVRPGVVSEMTGSALAVVATIDRPYFDPQRRLPCCYHARSDHYCLLPWGQTAGMALRWFRDTFFQHEIVAAAAAGVDAYDRMTAEAEGAPAGSDGLVVLPHLGGAFTPEYNPNAKGVFFGATLRTGRGHFVRALMESVAYMLKRQVDLVESMGFAVDQVRSIGGGARSRLWLQIKADVLGKPVRTTGSEETACLGAAMLGAVAAGFYGDLDVAAASMVTLQELVEPLNTSGVYVEGFQRYCELYDRLAPIFG